MPAGDIDALTRLMLTRPYPDPLAGTVMAETPVDSIVATGSVLWVTFTPSAALIHDAANYATLTVHKRTAGGAAVVVAQVSTSSGDWNPGVPVALSIVAAAVTANDMISVTIAKTGTGVIVPSGLFQILPSPTYIDQKIVDKTSFIYTRLGKRYAIPFVAPYPEAMLDWLTTLVTHEAFKKRGYNPGAADDDDAISGAATVALAEIKEASDAKDGLFDLPLRADIPGTSGVTVGPLGTSQASPYEWVDDQAAAIFSAGSSNG